MTAGSQPRSLLRRAVGIVLVAQILCALVLSTLALLHERRVRLKAFDVALMGHSDSVLGAIRDANDPEDHVTLDPTEFKLPGADRYVVYDEQGHVLGASSAAAAAQLPRGADGFRDTREAGAGYRVYQRQAVRIVDHDENQGAGFQRPVTIVYASPTHHIWHEIFEASGFYLLTAVITALLTAGIVVWLLRRALEPLEDLAGAAGALSPSSLVFKAPTSVLHVTELRPLAEVLERVVEGLREAFAKEHRFVGDAAHELKTAVAVVRSTAQVLTLRRRTVEEHEAGLQRVLEDTRRVEMLVAQMLSSAGAGEGSNLPVPRIDLREAVGETVAQLASLAEAQGVKVHADDLQTAEIRLRAQDASVLMSNLLQNAIQHSGAGSEVEVKVLCESSAVTLIVTDHGAGIGPEALPHVFERFFREDRSRARDTGGTGLGLAICKAIVDGAGGNIAIESAVGLGTTVTVVFTDV